MKTSEIIEKNKAIIDRFFIALADGYGSRIADYSVSKIELLEAGTRLNSYEVDSLTADPKTKKLLVKALLLYGVKKGVRTQYST